MCASETLNAAYECFSDEAVICAELIACQTDCESRNMKAVRLLPWSPRSWMFLEAVAALQRSRICYAGMSGRPTAAAATSQRKKEIIITITIMTTFTIAFTFTLAFIFTFREGCDGTTGRKHANPQLMKLTLVVDEVSVEVHSDAESELLQRLLEAGTQQHLLNKFPGGAALLRSAGGLATVHLVFLSGWLRRASHGSRAADIVPEVVLPSGARILGKRLNAVGHPIEDDVYAYFNLRYAEAARFDAPTVYEAPANAVLNGTEVNLPCLQRSGDDIQGVEAPRPDLQTSTSAAFGLSVFRSILALLVDVKVDFSQEAAQVSGWQKTQNESGELLMRSYNRALAAIIVMRFSCSLIFPPAPHWLVNFRASPGTWLLAYDVECGRVTWQRRLRYGTNRTQALIAGGTLRFSWCRLVIHPHRTCRLVVLCQKIHFIAGPIWAVPHAADNNVSLHVAVYFHLMVSYFLVVTFLVVSYLLVLQYLHVPWETQMGRVATRIVIGAAVVTILKMLKPVLSLCIEVEGVSVCSDGDCLTLAVYIPPAPIEAGKRPVVVQIHGGFLMSGGIAGDAQKGLGCGTHVTSSLVAFFRICELCSRSKLASDCVLVSIQYRLHLFGFFQPPVAGSFSANRGLRDQLAALSWVQRNIASFGGDPDSVGGGRSVVSLEQSPLSAGLFQRAIALSPGFLPAMFTADISEVERTSGQRCLNATGCTSLQCLRDLEANQLLEMCRFYQSPEEFIDVPGFYFSGYDGEVLTAPIQSMYCSGADKPHGDRPMILGSVTREWNIFSLSMSPADATGAFLQEFSDGSAQQGNSSYLQCRRSSLLAAIDPEPCPAGVLGCVLTSPALMQAATDIYSAGTALSLGPGSGPRYRYLLDTEGAGSTCSSCHGADMDLMYGLRSPFYVGQSYPQGRLDEMTSILMQYLVSFILTGTPTAAEGLAWAPVDRSGEKDTYGTPLMVFNLSAPSMAAQQPIGPNRAAAQESVSDVLAQLPELPEDAADGAVDFTVKASLPKLTEPALSATSLGDYLEARIKLKPMLVHASDAMADSTPQESQVSCPVLQRVALAPFGRLRGADDVSYSQPNSVGFLSFGGPLAGAEASALTSETPRTARGRSRTTESVLTPEAHWEAQALQPVSLSGDEPRASALAAPSQVLQNVQEDAWHPEEVPSQEKVYLWTPSLASQQSPSLSLNFPVLQPIPTIRSPFAKKAPGRPSIPSSLTPMKPPRPAQLRPAAVVEPRPDTPVEALPMASDLPSLPSHEAVQRWSSQLQPARSLLDEVLPPPSADLLLLSQQEPVQEPLWVASPTPPSLGAGDLEDVASSQRYAWSIQAPSDEAIAGDAELVVVSIVSSTTCCCCCWCCSMQLPLNDDDNDFDSYCAAAAATAAAAAAVAAAATVAFSDTAAPAAAVLAPAY
eukprot:s4050_g1.t1